MREAQLKPDDRCILVIAHAISLNQIVSRSNHLSKSNRLDGVMAIASTCHPVAVVNCIHFDWNALSCSKYNMLQHVVYLDIARRTSSFRKMDWCRGDRKNMTAFAVVADPEPVQPAAASAATAATRDGAAWEWGAAEGWLIRVMGQSGHAFETSISGMFCIVSYVLIQFVHGRFWASGLGAVGCWLAKCFVGPKILARRGRPQKLVVLCCSKEKALKLWSKTLALDFMSCEYSASCTE